MKNFIFPLVALIFSLFVNDVCSQTTLSGTILSIDGRPIPKTVISITAETPRDIFSGQYEDVVPGDDGSYRFQLRDPGIYRISFRGIFHHGATIPVLIYDQSSISMDILLLPMYYNEGLYFGNEEYMNWIRVLGNFNDYSYESGKNFSLNSDGSISAFIPVTSDTIRYQVRGLTYGRGTTALPFADSYDLHEDGSFESVLYKNLLPDSLEIRYTPGQTMPFERNIPTGVNPQTIRLRGIVHFKNPLDKNWIQPLSWFQIYNITFHVSIRDLSGGLQVETQNDIQRKYAGDAFEFDTEWVKNQIVTGLNNEKNHPQQHVLMTMAYAGVMGWTYRRQYFLERNQPGKDVPELTYDREIIMSIPDTVPPVHPAWRYNFGMIEFLLTTEDAKPQFVNYFRNVVKHHPDDRAVESAAMALIRLFSSEYSSVEKMPVYKIIADKYGEGEMTRTAEHTFARQQMLNGD